MRESPAYKSNYIEVKKALEQGVQYIENCNPIKALTDSSGHIVELVCMKSGEEVKIPARSVMFATGSKPNIAYYYENREELEISSGYYARENTFFAQSEKHQGYISILGDLHPDYQGSVVGALASAKDSYASILSSMPEGGYLDASMVINQFNVQLVALKETKNFIILTINTKINLPCGGYLRVTVYDENHVMSQISAVIVNQNEAWVRADCDEVIHLKQGRVSGILGPSGTRVVGKDATECVTIIADQWGLAWACSIGVSLQKQSKKSRLLLLGVTDHMLVNYFDEVIEVEHLMRSDFQETQDLYYCITAELLKHYQKKGFKSKQSFAVVDGPMMCYLKGVCGLCIQWQLTGDGSDLKAVYACSWPAQPLTIIDVDHAIVRQKRTQISRLYHNWKSAMTVRGDNYA